MSKRMESGSIQFGLDDWPGVFLRGDNAHMAAISLHLIVDRLKAEHPNEFRVEIQMLKDVCDDLRVPENLPYPNPNVTYLKSADQCRIDGSMTFWQRVKFVVFGG